MPIRVLLCDQHPTVRAGLLGLLSAWPDVEVVGCCSDGRSCLEALERHAVDVVLLDLQGPPHSLRWLSRLHARQPDARLLTLVPSPRPLAQDARLEPTDRAEPLDGAISPEQLRAALQGPATAPPPARAARRPADLTPREREVLGLVARGLSNKAIAGALGLSEHTVKNHLKKVLRKLGARNRTQAALWLRTAGA